jgi:hypothetical protein
MLALALGPSITNTAAAYTSGSSPSWLVFGFAVVMRAIRVAAGWWFAGTISHQRLNRTLARPRARRISFLGLLLFPTAWTAIPARLGRTSARYAATIAGVGILASQAMWMASIALLRTEIAAAINVIQRYWAVALPVTALVGAFVLAREWREVKGSIPEGLSHGSDATSH